MADDPILEQAIALRDMAYAELQSSAAYVRWRALDEAVRAMSAGAERGPSGNFLSKLKRPPSTAIYNVIPPRRISQAEGAIALLREANAPMSIADIVAGLPRVGAVVGGENPEINVSSSLSRDARVRSVRVGGKAMWWLSDEPLPRNEPEPDDFESLIGSGSSVSSSQEGGDGDAPATT